MIMVDRVKFILNTSVDFFANSLATTSISTPSDDILIRDFVENDDVHILAATIVENVDGSTNLSTNANHLPNKQLNFQHTVPTEENCLLFYKIPQFGNVTSLSTTIQSSSSSSSSSSQIGTNTNGGVGSSSTSNNNVTTTGRVDIPIGILTLDGGLVKSIYNSVLRVYSPHVTKQTEYTPEVENIIETLHSTLRSSLGLPQSGIHNIQDEIHFWSQKMVNSPTKSGKEKAKTFVEAMKSLNFQIKQFEFKSLRDLILFLDSAHTTLDEIWQLPHHFPQNRMIDLMDLICSTIIETCSDNLNTQDIFNVNSFQSNEVLNEVSEHIDAWLQVCDSLTRLFWPNNVSHQWIGESYVPKQAKHFQERLNEIKSIKLMYIQISTLFCDNPQMVKCIRGMFSPFKNINIYDITPYGNKQWKKAFYQFEIKLQPIDERMALIIKAQLHNCHDNPRQIIQIFSKYHTILSRNSIMKLLQAEREQFLNSLRSLYKELKECMGQSNLQYENQQENMSQLCFECRWYKVFQQQIVTISEISHIIEDHPGFADINKLFLDLKVESESLLNASFEQWREQSTDSVKGGDLTLKDDKPVVEFERDGRQLMQVTFKPKLVTFCQDVKQLENIGYRVPIELRDTAAHAVRFMGYARRLQQVATFHNTIGDRMIPCQRPIMLKNAMELSRLVQSESVAWNDEDSVNRYVTTMQEAVSNLSKDNTYLASQHEEFKRIIIKLMNIDLIRQSHIWKEEMRRLRDMIASLETKGYKNLNAFKLHWDYQLYKVLEHQYLAGILNLNNKLADIEIDIIFRQQELQFRPPMEEIRYKYYAQLRQFLERPLSFRGLSDQSSNIFKIMVDRNRHQFIGLYKKAEELFKQIIQIKDTWIPCIALGMVNLEELVNVHLTTWEDWDRNFKACKYFNQQTAKIQNTESRSDCFVINLSPLRSDIEFINRKFWETLASSLRVSILNDISVLQDFLQMSLHVLQNVPLDELGIAEAGAKYERIMLDLPKMSELLKLVESKDTCLAGWCRERVTALSGIQDQWHELQPLISNHSVVLQEQIERMRDQLETQMDGLKEEGEKFEIRWETTIEDLKQNESYNSTLFRDRQQNWNLLKEKREQLENDCVKYNVNFSSDLRDLFAKIDQDVTAQSKEFEYLEQFMEEFETLTAEEWTVYRRRPYILTDFLTKWTNNSNTITTNSTSLLRIRQLVDSYQLTLPTLQILHVDGITERHWAKIFGMMKQEPKPFHDILLRDILNNVQLLMDNSMEIQMIVRQASSEQVVRQALTELDQWGVTAQLKTTAHSDSKREIVMLIKDFQEILNKLGDNQCLLQSAKNSSAFEAFSDQASIWEIRLTVMDKILSSLNQIQRKWIYLEPIFSNGTLKSDEATFKRIDKDFRYIMREIANDPRLLSVTKINNITVIIESLESQLSRCQNTLTSFISTKRNAFPRFYFLADDDLLEILGQASKIDIIQKHISKLFPGISQLEIITSDSISLIKSICSAEGDKILLKTQIEITGLVENWLNQLVVEIKYTLMDLIGNCSQYDQFTADQIKFYPSQVLTTSKAISFTRQTEKSINSMSLAGHLRGIKDEIDLYNSSDYRNSDNLTQLKIRSLLVDLVHYAQLIEYLIDCGVTTVADWNWLQQLKFFINSKQLVTIRMVYAEFEYSYEYLANANKLVYTSLTHRCYLTLTQAMHLGLGGNPFGPAGTGKTECVKSLGQMLGRLVLVFNCNENVDTEAMGLILSGLSRCGAWGCFDEFNRLQEATLSTISMLIQPLQMAIKDKQNSVIIQTESIPLNPNCGIFVTLNPAGEEYGGRQNLPANLQALFRPIVMQYPEPKDIARVMLFSERFKNADEIGYRLVEVFNVANQILSPQRHYDWGLRELKTVLQACGKSLQLNDHQLGNDEESGVIRNNEMEVAVHALRTNTMSKLNGPDCKRFDMLIRDVFPNISLTVAGNTELRKLIDGAFSSLGLQSNERQIEKCLQLYEQLCKRTGVVILGPPSSGKTTIALVLKQALTAWKHTIRTYTIAPKSMTRVQLLGNLDPDTRQWNDGVLTTTAMAVNSEPLNITSWIICDGDVDPEWIEALNSVLDDNKLLTLPSGWRIQFGNNINFIFETHDLSHASPATISRMGIITLSAEDLTESNIITSWLQRHQSPDLLTMLIDQYLIKIIDWIENNITKLLNISRICLIQCGLEFLGEIKNKNDFCIGLLRGLGSILNGQDLNRFSAYLFDLTDIYVASKFEPELAFYNSFRDTIEMYETDSLSPDGGGSGGSVDKYNTTIELIRTGHMKMYADVLRQFLKSNDNIPFLIVGPSGSGKSLLLQNIVTEFANYQLVTINCSSQLNADFVLYVLKQNCLVVSGIRGREYKPKFTKIILYFKNIDLCNVDPWGTREIIELILQLIQRKGFYATETLDWISISGLQICGSIAEPGKHTVSPRFLSIVRQLVIGYPTERDMHVIVRNQMVPIYSKFKQDPRKMEDIVNALISVYRSVSSTFTKNQRNHYIFSPKLITNFLVGLINYPGDYFEKAFFNEIKSVFRNRLVESVSLEKFDEILLINLQHSFSIENINSFFLPLGSKSSELTYVTGDEWIETVQRNLTICSSEDIYLEQPITNEFLNITASICRVLSRPSTNLILSGLIGTGAIESLHVACTILHVKIIAPTPVANYRLDEFYNDLRIAIQIAAIEDQSIVLHVDHSWIVYLAESMRPIEAILEGSEIPDLFGDDLENVANPLRNAAQIDGYQESLTSYFWKRVKNNLHLVLTLESNNVQDLFMQYPTLYRNAEMIFIQSPSTTMLTELPEKILNLTRPNANVRIPMPKCVAHLNNDFGTSPMRYQFLVKTYIFIYEQYLENIQNQRNKLQAGVDKLSEAHSVVGTLKTQAQSQEIALAEKKKLANQALEMISTTMRNANDQRTDLLELKQKTQQSSEKLMERKKAIEFELKEVEPILKEATAAVGQIKGEALSEIRSLRAPPEIIRDILEGVLRLMGIRDTSWNSMKSFLAKRGVKEDIRSLDPVRISPENCQAVEKLLATKWESFEQKNAKRASAAAAPLASWVIANVKYSKVIQSIKPLEREQNQLKKNLDESESEMKSLISGLDDVDSKVKELSNQLNMHTQEAAVLEIKLEDARKTLNAAEVLVEKLSSEYSNWKKQLEELNEDLERLDTKSYLISLNITHLSHYTYDKRNNILSKIIEDLELTEFNVTKNIITEQDKIVWESIGLTADVQSIENAAILTKMLNLPFGTAPIPLLLDPSGSILFWLKEYLKLHSIATECISQNIERFTYNLELAVRFGKCLVVQDYQLAKPPLLAIILMIIHCRFNKKQMQIGNKFIDYHENFKLILITKMSDINVGPEIGAFITKIPFTTTIPGYTDQLLSTAIQLKQPDLEEKRIKLLQNEGKLWKERLELQDKLLQELSAAKGDILKNENLLATLNDVKESSADIDKSLIESAKIREQLMEEFNEYKAVCLDAATFFIGINKIYNISVPVFTNLFLKSIQSQDNISTKATISQLARLTFSMLSRSLSKSDHIMLGLHICKNAFPQLISEKEWELFITNFVSDEDISTTIPSWIKPEHTSKITCLQSNHPDLYVKLDLNNGNNWQQFTQNPSTTTDIPVNITEFQKILITQILRPDLLLLAITKAIVKLLGIKNMSVFKPSIQQMAEENNKDEPILLIATGDTDPSKEIQDYVNISIGRDKYMEFSVGKGQEQKALQCIRKAATDGSWICLKNVHLITDWLTTLNEELGQINIESSFRLWLVCDSIKSFPDALLVKCNKILYETPSGVKQKLFRLLQQWYPVISQKNDAKTIKLYIILFILNAILQERRTYIPQGWTKWYDFGDSDLRTAISIIGWATASAGSSLKIDWAVLRGLCQHIVYGGRINVQQDLDILLIHLAEFFDSKVMNNYWSPLQMNLTIPQSQNLQDYMSAIAQLSDMETPEILGLSASTNISKDLLFCRNLLKRLRNVHFASDGNESFEKRLRPILGLWKKLTSASHVVKTYGNIISESQTEENPWNSFILSELNLAGKLFISIQNSLIDLNRAVKGIESIGEKDRKIVLEICENQVPKEWRQLWQGPKLLTDFLRGVVQRGIAAEERYQTNNGGQNSKFGEHISFAMVFNLESYLAALKLTNARELGKSTCDLILTSSLSDGSNNVGVSSSSQLMNNKMDTITKPKIGSLLIDGATFKNNKIIMMDTNSKQYENLAASILPEFQIYYCVSNMITTPQTTSTNTIKNTISEFSNKDMIELPLYSNSSRDHLICTLRLATSPTTTVTTSVTTNEAIILSGVALIVPDVVSSGK